MFENNYEQLLQERFQAADTWQAAALTLVVTAASANPAGMVQEIQSSGDCNTSH
jgi:hypothetical protein